MSRKSRTGSEDRWPVGQRRMVLVRGQIKWGLSGRLQVNFNYICFIQDHGEIIIVRSFLCPAFSQPIMESAIADQYAFRPTGSTTAALISLLHTVTQMLITNSICCRHCYGLQQSLRYCASHSITWKDGQPWSIEFSHWKILGVIISNKLSVAEHVCNIIRSSAQTCHALRLLRAHGTAWPMHRYRSSIEQSSPPSWHTLRVRGEASPLKLTVNA